MLSGAYQKDLKYFCTILQTQDVPLCGGKTTKEEFDAIVEKSSFLINFSSSILFVFYLL